MEGSDRDRTRSRWGRHGHRAFAIAGILAAIVIAGGHAPTSAQGTTSALTWTHVLDDTIATTMQDLRIPGLAIAVVRDGAITYERGYGTARPDGTAVTPTTPFVLASTSKALTGLAVSRLVADGRLTLDATLGSLIPTVADGTDANVSVRQLLSHTSGIPRDVGVANWTEDGGGDDAIQRDAVRIGTSPLARAPGQGFTYSNANYDLLGAVIEAVTGTTYGKAMEMLVLGPLGMAGTFTDRPPALEAGLADGWYDWFGVMSVATPMPYPRSSVPSAFLISSAHDLAQELLAHLGAVPSAPAAGTPPTAAELLASRTPLVTLDGGTGYAMGWWVHPASAVQDIGMKTPGNAQVTMVEHDGSSPVTDSYVGFIPELDVGFAYVANTGDPQGRAAWDYIPTALWRVILGAEAGAPGPDLDLIRANARSLYIAVTLLLLVSVLVGMRALAGHGRPRVRKAVIIGASVVCAGACYLALVHAPRVGDTTLGTLVRWTPDLGLMTVVIAVLTVTWVLALLVAARRAAVRRGAVSPARRLP